MNSRRRFIQNISASALGLSLLPKNALENIPGVRHSADEQSLAGEWQFRLDPENAGIKENWFSTEMPDRIPLPGSCQENGFGIKNTVRETDRLTHPVRYEGVAWYRRSLDIPASWNGKRLELFLERCYWESTVWLDGKAHEPQSGLSAPHLHDLGIVRSGKHTLSIRVDNTYRWPIGRWGFAITDDTQGNWNGIIGEILLRATDPVWIRDVQVYSTHLKVKIANSTGRLLKGTLQQHPVNIPASGASLEIPFQPAGPNWDEFSPLMNTLILRLKAEGYTDEKTVSYGIRNLDTKNGQFLLNGRPVLMRGPVNECVYPLTSYPPTDRASWQRLFNICKSYGFNFMRFNSWCPPEAAFQSADELGIFLQVEIPFWSMLTDDYGKNAARDQFLLDELTRILEHYGNHPSFAFLAMGNESGGPMNELVNKARAIDRRRLYRCQDGDVKANGDYAERGTEIGQRGIKGPRTDWDRWTLIDDPEVKKYKQSGLPVLAHEVGQWASYPDFDQIAKFTGTPKPYNYERFRDSLARHQMADQNKAFAQASGKFAVSLYKEEIEACLRTYPHGGFQIVEARDFPGEGCAIIGWLDAFWDSKGLITPEAFRRFCGPTVCLLRMPQRIYTGREEFKARLEIAHYGPRDIASPVLWKIEDAKGEILHSGTLPRIEIPTGKLSEAGEIRVPLHGISRASKLLVTVSAGGTSNSWNIWVYPEEKSVGPESVYISHAFDDDTHRALISGARVILFSSPKQGLVEIKEAFLGPDEVRQFPPVSKGKSAIPGSFMPAFWNMRLFNQIGTLGILCDPEHPALAGFPTEAYSDWQWADLLGRYTAKASYKIAGDDAKHDWGDATDRSKAIMLNETPPDYRPIVQMIDNYERNYKLGLIFETLVGKGKLLICALDLDTDAGNRPAARQLKSCLLNYAAGDSFQPQHELPLALLEKILG